MGEAAGLSFFLEPMLVICFNYKLNMTTRLINGPPNLAKSEFLELEFLELQFLGLN